MQAATEYHIEMFDVENDEYAVNEYITTDQRKLHCRLNYSKRAEITDLS